jgi:hypothetical protein
MMWGWLLDGRRLIALAIAAATLVGVWMFRYEPIGESGWYHRNRLAGATCTVRQECW